MPKLRDPAFDPMRAPTSRGLHPHMHRAGLERVGEQDCYENVDNVREQLAIHDSRANLQLGSVDSTPPQTLFEWVSEHPFLVAGAIVGTALLTRRFFDGEAHIPTAVMPSQPIVMMAVPSAVPAVAVQAAPAPVKEEKKSRTRRTTQARDAKGHYLSAQTRARSVIEGKG